VLPQDDGIIVAETKVVLVLIHETIIRAFTEELAQATGKFELNYGAQVTVRAYIETCSSLHRKVFKLTQESVQVYTEMCSSLHRKVFKFTQKCVRAYTGKCSSLESVRAYMEKKKVFKLPQESVRTCIGKYSCLQISFCV